MSRDLIVGTQSVEARPWRPSHPRRAASLVAAHAVGVGATLHTASDGCPHPSTAAALDVWAWRELEARRGGALSAAHSAARHAGATASARRELVAGPRGGAVRAGGSANPTDPTYLESRDSARRSARHGGSGGSGGSGEGSTPAHPPR